MRTHDIARRVALAATWGALFLGELVTPIMLVDAAAIVAGTTLVLGVFGTRRWVPAP